MIEKQSINGRDIWVEVVPYHVQRDNPRTIPTEYFTARYFFEEPVSSKTDNGATIVDKDGLPKLFESPVAALEFTSQRMSELT